MELAGGALMKLAPSDFYLSRIAIDQRFAGSGVANDLINHCVGKARRCGAARICLEVAMENARAIRFYKRCGFEQTDERSIGAPGGRKLSYLHMVKQTGLGGSERAVLSPQ
jgi:ribosomal protein S18 acetylase RimI-like enzyme